MSGEQSGAQGGEQSCWYLLIDWDGVWVFIYTGQEVVCVEYTLYIVLRRCIWVGIDV